MSEEKGLIDETDRKIMQMRALGYDQLTIAQNLNLSQPSISNRIQKINNIAQSSPVSNDEVFWQLILGVGAIVLVNALLKR